MELLIMTPEQIASLKERVEAEIERRRKAGTWPETDKQKKLPKNSKNAE